MKKLLAVIMSVAMILSLSAVMANAVVRIGENSDGVVNIQWDDEADFEFDGDISEWADAGYTFTTITAENFYAWSGTVDADFAINAYFVADSEWLYVGFFIADSDWVKSTGDKTSVGGSYGNCDAFQIAVDFGTFMETSLNDGTADYGNNKSIFYSFACYEEGEPLVFARQESYADAVLSEANGDGVKGAAGAYEGGWCAEFAISWNQMYQDLTIKTLEVDQTFDFNADSDFQLGVLLCYLNHVNEEGTVKRTWMAGTTKSDKCDWDPRDSGLYLNVEWDEGRYIDCVGINNSDEVVGGDDETTVDDDVTTEEVTTEEVTTEATTTEAATTEAATTEADTTVADTTADETEAKTEAKTTAAATTAAPVKGGCGSVVGSAVAVAVIAIAGAAAVVLKKKD